MYHWPSLLYLWFGVALLLGWRIGAGDEHGKGQPERERTHSVVGGAVSGLVTNSAIDGKWLTNVGPS